MDDDLREVMKDVPDLYVGPVRSAGCGLREGTDPLRPGGSAKGGQQRCGVAPSSTLTCCSGSSMRSMDRRVLSGSRDAGRTSTAAFE